MGSIHFPLRTALIGLSSSAATSWAATAHLPALLSETGRSKFVIKGLLNSSIDAAKLAIETYQLPNDTKAYSSPEALAADPDIDLVICNTRVDKHYEVVIPSIRAGKDVFVEWPIAGNKKQIDELVNAAKQSGSRVAVGLQRRWNPVVMKVKDLISGSEVSLGKLLSADARIFGGLFDRETLPLGLKYFTQKDIGGNIIVIGVGHEISTIQAKTQIQRPKVPLRDPSKNEIVEHVISDVPDLLTFNARLQSSERIAENATLAFFFRRGQPFPGTPQLTWRINFEYGEIEVLSLSSGFLDFGHDDKSVTIRVHSFNNDAIEEIEWSSCLEHSELPFVARAVSATLYSFADRKPSGDGWVGLEDAAHRAELIEKLLNA